MLDVVCHVDVAEDVRDTGDGRMEEGVAGFLEVGGGLCKSAIKVGDGQRLLSLDGCVGLDTNGWGLEEAR